MRNLDSKFHFDNLFYFDPIKIGPFILYQVGDIFTTSDYKGGLHEQFCHEITYVVSGCGTTSINNTLYCLKQGNLVLTKYGALHEISSDKNNPLRFFYLGFLFDKDDQEYKNYLDIEKQLLSITNPICTNRYDMHSIFQMIFSEMISESYGQLTFMRACIEQIVVYTIRNFFSKSEDKPSSRYLQKNKELVYDIIYYINNHFFDIKSFDDICNYAGYSYSYASKVFSAVMDMSINQYYQNVRFKKAIELLNAKFTVTQVSTSLGYSSIHSFSRAFKNHFGISPSEYLDSNNKNNSN